MTERPPLRVLRPGEDRERKPEARPAARVAFYGFEWDIRPKSPPNVLRGETWEAHFVARDSDAPLCNFDLVIASTGAWGLAPDWEAERSDWRWAVRDVGRRSREIHTVLERGGLFCEVIAEDVPLHFGLFDQLQDQAVTRSLPDDPYWPASALVVPTAHGTPLRDYFSEFGVARGFVESVADEVPDTIALGTTDDRTVAALVDHRVAVVPCHLGTDSPQRLARAMTLLVDGLLRLMAMRSTAAPPWAGRFPLADEPALLREEAALQKRLSEIRERLESIQVLKSALWEQGEALHKPVAALFRVLGFDPVPPPVEGREDLVLRWRGKDRALVEVKGVGKSVTRAYVSQLATHRDEAGERATFPAILVVNTFAEKTTPGEKDRRVANAIIAHAHRHHVLVLRALDLCRLADLVMRRKRTASQGRAVLLHSTGWLRVRQDGWRVETV